MGRHHDGDDRAGESRTEVVRGPQPGSGMKDASGRHGAARRTWCAVANLFDGRPRPGLDATVPSSTRRPTTVCPPLMTHAVPPNEILDTRPLTSADLTPVPGVLDISAPAGQNCQFGVLAARFALNPSAERSRPPAHRRGAAAACPATRLAAPGTPTASGSRHYRRDRRSSPGSPRPPRLSRTSARLG